MSDTNLEGKAAPYQASNNFAVEAAAAWSKPEVETVLKEQIAKEAAPGIEQTSFPQSTKTQWAIRRGQSGAIAHLKEGDNDTVSVRKDDLGKNANGGNVTGYSFRRNINNAVLEQRIVLSDVGQGRFTGIEDSVVYKPGEQGNRLYVREAIAGSLDNSVMTNINMKHFASTASTERQWLTNKMSELNRRLGAPGSMPEGEVCIDAALDQGISAGNYYSGKTLQPGNFYTNLANDSNVRPTKVPVQQGHWNGYAQGLPTPVRVESGHWNGYAQGQPTDVPVQKGHWSGYAQGKPNEVPVQSGRWNGYAQGQPIDVPVLNGGRHTNDGSRYNHLGVSPGRNTHDGSFYQHIPMNGNTMVTDNNDPFRKPKRPIQNRLEPVREPVYVPQPVQEAQKPTFTPVERKPVVQQPGSGEGGSSQYVKTDVEGQLLPFKKKQ